MRIRHAAALALIVLTSCGPNMTTIDANARAERAAQRAQAAQLRAERSAALAADAVGRTKSADYSMYPGDGAAAFGEDSAEWWAMKDPQNAGAARLQIPFAEPFDIAIPFLSE